MIATIGIDPGLSGALAVLISEELGESIHGWVNDTCVIKPDKGRTLMDAHGCLELLKTAIRLTSPRKTHVFIESVHAMPKQGVSSSFNFGTGYGMWLGLLAASGLPYTLVTPQRWKGVMLDGLGREKQMARMRAMQLLPGMRESLLRAKDDGRAEALLIAMYGQKTFGVIDKNALDSVPQLV